MNAALSPMLASLADAPLDDPQFVYEPKYDGIRAIAEIGDEGDKGGRVSVRRTDKGGRMSAKRTDTRPSVHLWSRNGNEKTAQFPEIAAALAAWARTRKAPLVLDGEIVALDANGEPAGFQQLQGRIHGGGRESVQDADSRPPSSVAFIVFDILRKGRTDFRERPLLERRAALERLFAGERVSVDRKGTGGRVSADRKVTRPLVRISTMVRGDGRALHKEALDRGWEGLIAKRADSLYRSGKRTPDWRKIKLVHEQEFVIGGWTEPRQTRAYFGALLLGVYEERAEGSGQRAHLIYTGHTGTGFDERELARVMARLTPLETKDCPFTPTPRTNERPHWVRPELVAEIKFTEWTADAKLRHPVYLGLRDDKKPTDVRREAHARVPGSSFHVHGLLDQLRDLESARKDGTLVLPGGDSLNVTNLHKVFWPKQKLTKGDLFRYYVRVAPFVLPAIADRPLVMKRFPNGIAAPPFYQHRAPEVPPGVRAEVVGVAETRPQIIGGHLKTLLYTTQLAAISQDPWFSRVAHPEFADYAAFDLDPSDGVPFERVLDVARWIRDELDMLGTTGVPKTSGADGLHIYLPLPPVTPYDAGLLFCQIVATVVVQKHPKVATIERRVSARGKRVYVDCLQNIQGKTLATAYSARASDYAGVSTPVSWKEIDEGFDRRDFTITTVPGRLEKVGDLWAALRKSKGVDLTRVTRYTERRT